MNPYACPECGGDRGLRRTGGPWYEGQLRCRDCRHVWEPDAIERLNDQAAKEQANVGGDGI